MALSRFNSMLSWNPFSKVFWKSENWSGKSLAKPQFDLNAERRFLLSAVDDVIPDCIKDMVIMSFPEDPVFSPYGHCFDRQTLISHWQTQRTCPFTMRPLHPGMLLETKQVAGILSHFNVIKHYRDLLLNKINQMSLETKADVLNDLDNFKRMVEFKKQAIQDQIDLIVARDRINMRKERWQIDSSSTTHLQSWHQERVGTLVNILPKLMQGPILVTTGHEVIHDSQKRPYVIPKSIATIMHSAEREYRSADDFLTEIKKNIRGEKNSWRRHICCSSRSKREQAFLDAEDIDKLDMRKMI
ncbi:MAG: U-box domain-containing protein [Gammaproteobacteria bacterium]